VAPNRIVVEVPGRAAAIEADRIAELAQISPGIRSVLLKHEQFFLAEVQQSAACNAVHTVEQRVCRSMLRMNDLIGMKVPVTQEMLSQMIGVRRTSVTLAASSLQQAGVISYRRGHIQIPDMTIDNEILFFDSKLERGHRVSARSNFRRFFRRISLIPS
jgi:CRP-like cAMP-binding protein